MLVLLGLNIYSCTIIELLMLENSFEIKSNHNPNGVWGS